MPGQIAARLVRITREQRRATIAAAVAIALAISGAVVWSVDGDLRDAEVVLRAGAGVTVTTPGGVARSAVDGETLPNDAVVSTAAGATATLDVRDRLVLLAPETTVAVPDGSSASLRRGSILIDRRRGPGLTLDAGAVTLDEVDEGAVRVDRGFSVRVTVLSGGVRATTSDRRLEITRLRQVAVAGRALPDRPTPVRLTGDDWERLVIPAVIAADAELTQIARGIDGDRRLADAARTQLLPAVYREPLAQLPTDAGRSEALLPVAIGLAVDASMVSDARALRAEGGSWGVVASLVGARTAAVSARLAELLAGPGERPASGDPQAGETAGASIVFPTSSTSSARPSATPTGPRPTGPTSPSPTPTSSPSEDPLGPITDLLPSGTPTPTTPGAVQSPSPSPFPILGTPAPATSGAALGSILRALLG
ncbi:MAG TPA: hypothetical protein VNA14_13725 [Mycobacteriales bacterium]|nr:hypothetical protein [Mycobacteriales bacterium]